MSDTDGYSVNVYVFIHLTQICGAETLLWALPIRFLLFSPQSPDPPHKARPHSMDISVLSTNHSFGSSASEKLHFVLRLPLFFLRETKEECMSELQNLTCTTTWM